MLTAELTGSHIMGVFRRGVPQSFADVLDVVVRKGMSPE